MSATETAERAWRRLAVGLLVAGVASIGGSLIWPSWAMVRPAWSPEQARRLQAASAKFHRLSHEHADAAHHDDAQEPSAEFRAAQQEFQSLRDQLEAARGRGANGAALLRLVGVVLVIAGGVTYLVGLRSQADSG